MSGHIAIEAHIRASIADFAESQCYPSIGTMDVIVALTQILGTAIGRHVRDTSRAEGLVELTSQRLSMLAASAAMDRMAEDSGYAGMRGEA